MRSSLSKQLYITVRLINLPFKPGCWQAPDEPIKNKTKKNASTKYNMFRGSKSRRSFGPYDVMFRAIVLKLNIIYSSLMSQNLWNLRLVVFVFWNKMSKICQTWLKNSFFEDFLDYNSNTFMHR